MLTRLLRKIGRCLVEQQDPRYRNLPLVLPNAWHGSGKPLTAEDYERLNLNVRDMGFDPKVVSQQPHNQMLLAIARGAQQRAGVKHED
jgi:hypothetical protein